MISAIVYNSKTGSCKKYAEMLSAKLAVPAFPYGDSHVRQEGQVIYVSWVMAGSVVGYAKAAKEMSIAAVVAVGMAPVAENSVESGRSKNKIPADVAFFCRQGGFHMDKLPRPMRMIMKLKVKDIAKQLESKKASGSLDAQEQAMYRMATTGVGEPAEWKVDDIVAWAKNS